MKNYIQIFIVALIASLIGGFVVSRISPESVIDLSGVTNYDTLDVSDGYQVDGTTVISGSGAITIGSSGDSISMIQSGTCNAITETLPLEATSTDMFYCSGLSGLVAGDRVIVTLDEDDSYIQGGLVTTFAVATSTTGFEFGILNMTGAATSSFALSTTSVKYLILR